ncbi:tectonic-2-like isoform X2 [Pomacea canaliculata]|uniref:tectonic-2-like isoform X2 n=1 Tax=Pomacea canaliculata TaxID=400727 RepID=UPI000D732354|nr:tectonic-2-like isoform X2 [Pomacea canaliculata]
MGFNTLVIFSSLFFIFNCAQISATAKPAPVVSFCDQKMTLPSQGIFTVRLSEAVSVNTTVTVNCSMVDIAKLSICKRPGVICCKSNFTSLTFDTVIVSAGQATATITFNVTSEGECIGVQCSAASNQMNADRQYQYMTNSSLDWSSEALFVKDHAKIQMVPHHAQVYDTTFQAFLYLDKNQNIDVTFQCQATIVGSVREALDQQNSPQCDFVTATTLAPTITTIPTTTTTTTTTSFSSRWVAETNSFNIPTGKLYYVVKTKREFLVTAPVQEIVVTTCCSVGNSSKYTGSAVAMVAVADLQPLVCTNCSGGVTDTSPSTERFVINPAYQEVAPCPCDLTFRACDINCCCDQECIASEKETFRACIPGLAGGQGQDPYLHSCQSAHFPKVDWFPVMCVQFESNALLGYFYSNTQKLTSLTDINSLVAQKTDLFTYREAENRYADLDQVSGYKDGSVILTVLGEGSSSVYGTLSLPQQSPSGQCIDSAPVRYLRNSQAACNRKLTEATCGNFSVFSAQSYIESSGIFNPACPRTTVSSSGQLGSNVKVDVAYYCTSTYTGYTRLAQTYADSVQPDKEYSFISGLGNVTCTDPCQECFLYNSGRQEEISNPLPARCNFDSDFDLPPPPVFDQITSSCQNFVLEVRYDIKWAGQNVVGLTAHVVLGTNMTMTAAKDITQRFQVTFVHNYTGPSNQSDNFDSVTTQYQRSGRPGYDLGMPLQTGCTQINSTTGAFEGVNTTQEKQMAVFSPGLDGLCESARRRTLTFGDNMMSSCILRLAINSISNCVSLKQLILNHLNVLMPSGVIGRFGFSNSSNKNMWITVLRQSPYDQEVTDTNTTTAATTTTAASNTPTAANTTAGGMENVEVSLLSSRQGICYNITTGIHLEIMYAETGRSKGYPLLEVVGAMIRYSLGNWSMSCTGADSAGCLNNSIHTQSFVLTSSVQFTQVSPTTPVKPILFYTIHNKETCDSNSCYRFFEDFDTSVCHFDTCWYELFYPLTSAYRGYEGLSYTRAFSLLFVLFFIGYIAVSKPWK